MPASTTTGLSAELMRQAREVAGLTQPDLARAISALGTPTLRNTVAGWERRGGNVPRKREAEIRQALAVPLRLLSENPNVSPDDCQRAEAQAREFDRTRPAGLGPDDIAAALQQAEIPTLLNELATRASRAERELGRGTTMTPQQRTQSHRVFQAAGLKWQPDATQPPRRIEPGTVTGTLPTHLVGTALSRTTTTAIVIAVANRIGKIERGLAALGGNLDADREAAAASLLVTAGVCEPDTSNRAARFVLAERALMVRE